MKVYFKTVVAKFKPEHGCLVGDGERLAVKPLKKVKLSTGKAHHFVSAADLRTKSTIGWVEGSAPFNLEEFLRSLAPNKLNPNTVEACQKMLDTVDTIEIGRPVAVSYMRRGIPPSMELVVHRVILHSPKQEDTKASRSRRGSA